MVEQGKALVTGGHGFLGSHLVEVLLERGLQVRCLLRPERSTDVFGDSRVAVARGDLRRTDGLTEAVEGVDYVFHVAGLIAAAGPADFHAVNVEGTKRLARAVAEAAPGCRRFVYVSSQAAAGPSPDGRPIGEEHAPLPLTHYGRSKLAGERVLPHALGPVPYTILRPPAIYGPRDPALLPFFQLASKGVFPSLDGRGRRFNLLHARDVAEAVAAGAFAAEAAGRTYFLADRTGVSYPELADALGRAFGRRARRVPVPDLVLDLAAMLTDEVAALLGIVPVFGREKARELKARWWLCSAERAMRELGWSARIPLHDGMAATARWYVDAGWVKAPRRAPSPL